MAQPKAIVPLESNLPPALKPPEFMTMLECSAEGEKLRSQFIIIHNLPKVNGQGPVEYMHQTLEVMRKRCNALHWRQCELLSRSHKK